VAEMLMRETKVVLIILKHGPNLGYVMDVLLPHFFIVGPINQLQLRRSGIPAQSSSIVLEKR
jgi:hypothetical protein